uniref:Uncharacterized protein n=1 Tax=Panagrolaimus superbus TaxID=310955 RepID=A0A914YWS3_9BILA
MQKAKIDENSADFVIKYLEEYIEFLEENKNREGVSDCLNNLKTELLKYQKIQNDSQEIPDTTSSQDQYDILKDDEVFEEIEKYYKLEDKAEKEKEKIESKDKFGETSLHRAAKESLEEVKFLIERCGAKAVINARDHSNWTPLSEAVNHGHVDIVQYLIQNGADMNTLSTEQPMKSDDDECTGESWSPLMEACYNGYFKMIHILIAKGANPCLMNANGWTAADFLEVFIKSPFMEKSEAVKFGYFLKHLREREARDETIKNREKKSNSSNEKPKKEIPKLHVRKREKGGGELFQEVIAFTARPNRQTANQMFREYIIKEDEDDEMFEDDEKFIAPESDDDDGDEEMNNENYKGEDSDEAMEIDDEKFRQNNGFFGSTKMNNRKKAKRASTPKQKLKRNSSRNDLDEDVVVLSQDSVEEVEEIRLKKTRKSKSEALKRRSSNRSFESSSSKKTKRSESISNDSEILSISKMVDMNSLSLTQQQQPLPPRLNVKAKELDFSFSKDVTEVSETIKLHLNLKNFF